MESKTYAKIRERRPFTRRGKIVAGIWITLYTWIFTQALVEVSSQISVTNLVILAFASGVTWFQAVKYEIDGRRWTKWEDVSVKGERGD